MVSRHVTRSAGMDGIRFESLMVKGLVNQDFFFPPHEMEHAEIAHGIVNRWTICSKEKVDSTKATVREYT